MKPFLVIILCFLLLAAACNGDNEEPQPTPAGTSTAVFHSLIGMGQYWVVTTEQVGSIPPNTRVRVSTAHFDGNEWFYSISPQGDEQLFEEARESQLAYAPDATPGAPTPTTAP